jgi:hypothetical protein
VVPCLQNGKPVVFRGTTTESGVRAFANDHPSALETAIEVDGLLVVVATLEEAEAVVTATPPPLEPGADSAPVKSAPFEPAAVPPAPRGPKPLDAAQRALKRAKDRVWIAQKRRAEGVRPRAEWLHEHAVRPWIRAGLSKSVYYRTRVKGVSVA